MTRDRTAIARLLYAADGDMHIIDLADRPAIHAQAGRDLVLRPPRVPVVKISEMSLTSMVLLAIGPRSGRGTLLGSR